MVATTTMPLHYNLSLGFRQDGKWLGVYLLYSKRQRGVRLDAYTLLFWFSYKILGGQSERGCSLKVKRELT